jgi:hypothetical protein
MTLMGEMVTAKARGSISPTTNLTDGSATHLRRTRLCSSRSHIDRVTDHRPAGKEA